MNEYLAASLFNGIVVTIGVYVLWTITHWVPRPLRVRYAALVGGAAAVLTLVVTSLIAAGT